jgi:lipopolysaccharide export system protein LptA
LQAFLKDSTSETKDESKGETGGDTAIDKAYADGAVKIVSVSNTPKLKRTRTGLSEHAEYTMTDQKLFLEGGQPQLLDSEKGKTTGKQLTWFANNDRLLVDGEEQKPAVTTLRKK